MTETWGAPDRKDPTASWEQDIEQASDQAVKFIREDGWKVLNRPIGSVPKSLDEEFQDWADNSHIPDYWQPQFDMLQKRGFSRDQAKLTLLEHDAKMREHAEEQYDGAA